MKAFKVVISDDAASDILRLQEFPIERESGSDSPDWTLIERSLEAMERGWAKLEAEPFLCRRAFRGGPFTRELIIPFGRTGYVALFEIRSSDRVIVTAVRHQLEADYFTK